MIINNEYLKKFLVVVLNKSAENINVDDINRIKTVRISNASKDKQQNDDFTDLKKFTNLNKIIIANSLIKEDDIIVLSSISSLSSVEFEKCAFEPETLLSSLNGIDSLTLNNCIINNYSFIESLVRLTELQILNPCDETELDMSLINNSTLLKKLYLERCILKNIDLVRLPNLEELSMLDTEIDNFTFLNNIPKLALMFISERYLENPIVKINKERITFKTNFIEYAFEDSKLTNSM